MVPPSLNIVIDVPNFPPELLTLLREHFTAQRHWLHVSPEQFNEKKITFNIKGHIGQSDLRLNNLDAVFQLRLGEHTIGQAYLESFTKNCGVKQIHHISVNPHSTEMIKYFMKSLEGFANHCCNATLLIGSDVTFGSSAFACRHAGGYIFTPEEQNYNYHSREHKIYLFYKKLNRDDYENFWGKHWDTKDSV